MVVFLFLSRVFSWRSSPGTTGTVHAAHFLLCAVPLASFHRLNRLQGARWILHEHVVRVSLVGSRQGSYPCTHTADHSRRASPVECRSCTRMIHLLPTRVCFQLPQDPSVYGARRDGRFPVVDYFFSYLTRGIQFLPWQKFPPPLTFHRPCSTPRSATSDEGRIQPRLVQDSQRSVSASGRSMPAAFPG